MIEPWPASSVLMIAPWITAKPPPEEAVRLSRTTWWFSASYSTSKIFCDVVLPDGVAGSSAARPGLSASTAPVMSVNCDPVLAL